MPISLNNCHVLVLGLGQTGQSMVRWLLQQRARVRAADTRALPPGLPAIRDMMAASDIFCGELGPEVLQDIALLAVSPGIAADHPVLSQAQEHGIPVVGDVELFARYHRHETVISVTGSNGKTTVTSLVQHLCRHIGMDAIAAGNISPAILDAVMARAERPPAIWVLELSSFQLETTRSLCSSAAAVLNVSEDHLDRYQQDLKRYAAVKGRIYQGCQQPVINRDDRLAASLCSGVEGKPLISFGLDKPVHEHQFGLAPCGDEDWLMQGEHALLPVSELQLIGRHNLSNALAALALCYAAGLPVARLLPGLRTFSGLPHRVQTVSRFHEVDYIDDSKGTNVGATVAAIEGMQRSVVLLAGGVGKGQDFQVLQPVIQQYARAVILMGQDAAIIEAALQPTGVALHRAESMHEAVQLAAELACPGDAVLLSPACASQDMFDNYQHRASEFVKSVQTLTQGAMA